MDELNSLLAQIWGNWTFRLSLSSNELFHSNILQFFAESLADAPEAVLMMAPEPPDDEEAGEEGANVPAALTVGAAKQLLHILCGDDSKRQGRMRTLLDRLEGLGPTSRLQVRREWKNLDLAVIWEDVGPRGGQLYRVLFALEVKIKAYPTAKQLAECRSVLDQSWNGAAVAFTPPLFLLTGMGATDAIGEDTLIESLNFGDLATRLSEAGLVGALQSEYISLCGLLHNFFGLLEAFLRRPDFTWERAEWMSQQLYPYRLHSVWWKVWAAFAARQCESAVQLEPAPDASLLHTHAGFTRGGNFGISWQWSNEAAQKANVELISLGVQVERDSLRLYLNIQHPALGNRANARRAVERVLLKLIAKHGLFAQGAHFRYLLNQWRLHQQTGGNPFGNGDLLGAFDEEAELLPEHPLLSEVFRPVEANAPRGAFAPMLTGYSNADQNGHADIRLSINETATISSVASAIRQILVEDAYSRVALGAAASPLLLQIVESFRHSHDRVAWLAEPDLAFEPAG